MKVRSHQHQRVQGDDSSEETDCYARLRPSRAWRWAAFGCRSRGRPVHQGALHRSDLQLGRLLCRRSRSAAPGTNEQCINTGNTTLFGDLDRQARVVRQRGSGALWRLASIGYNWQAGNYVFGLEARFRGLGQLRHCAAHRAFGRRDDQFSWRRTGWRRHRPARLCRRTFDLFLREGRLCRREQSTCRSSTLSRVDRCSGAQTHWHNGWYRRRRLGIRHSPRTGFVGLEYDYSAFEASNTYQLAGAAPGTYTFDAKTSATFSRPVVRLSYNSGALRWSRGTESPSLDQTAKSPGMSGAFFVAEVLQRDVGAIP